jgi:hypothetical protein
MPPKTRSKGSKEATTADPENLRKWLRTINRKDIYVNPAYEEFWKDDVNEDNRQEWMANQRNFLLGFLEDMRAVAEHIPTRDHKRDYEAAIQADWNSNWEHQADFGTGEIHNTTARRKLGKSMNAAYNASLDGYDREMAEIGHFQYRLAQGLWEGKTCSYII